MPAGLDKDDWSDSDYDLTEDDDESDSSGNGLPIKVLHFRRYRNLTLNHCKVQIVSTVF